MNIKITPDKYRPGKYRHLANIGQATTRATAQVLLQRGFPATSARIKPEIFFFSGGYHGMIGSLTEAQNTKGGHRKKKVIKLRTFSVPPLAPPPPSASTDFYGGLFSKSAY